MALSLCAVFANCGIKEDIENISNGTNPNVALPLFYSKLSLKDMIGSKNATALKIDADNKMRFYYKSDFTERSALDILKIFSGTTLPLPFADSTAFLPILKSSELTIKKIVYKKGTLIGFTAQLPQGSAPDDINLKIWLPDLTKNGKAYEINYKGKMTTAVNIVSLPLDLEGYQLRPSPLGADSVSVQVRYRASNSKGAPIRVNCIGYVNNPAFSYMEAYMPKTLLEIDEGNVDVSLYNQIIKGDLSFEDPRITVLIENSYGFPMRTKVNLIKAISKRGDTISLVAKNLVNDGFDIPYPKNTEVGEIKKARFDFTKENSNIRELLNAGPNTILYDIDAVANPDNLVGNGFMTDSTRLRIGIEVDIPIYASAKNFESRDTIRDIDFSAIANTNQAELKLVSENELPVGVNIQGIFLDASGRELGKLSDASFKLIEAAKVDAQGNVIKASNSEVFIPLTTERIANIRNANRLVLITSFATTDTGLKSVRVLANQSVSIRAGIKVIL